MAGVEQRRVLELGPTVVVTLTVAPGVDLDAVGLAFSERLGGLFSGAWLVPETSTKGRRHYHGLVVGADPGAILAAWQRAGGGIASSQHFDPIEPGDHWHLLRAVAYSMKRRHLEPGEVVASGVLASPWAAAQPDHDPDEPLGAEIDHLDPAEADEPGPDLESDEPLGSDVAHLDPEPLHQDAPPLPGARRDHHDPLDPLDPLGPLGPLGENEVTA